MYNKKITAFVIVLLFITSIAMISGCTSSKSNAIELNVDKSNEITLKPGQIAVFHNGNWPVPFINDNGSLEVTIDTETKTSNSKIAIMLVDSENYDKVSNGWTTYQQFYYPKDTYIPTPWSDTINMPMDSYLVLKNVGTMDTKLLIRLKLY